MPREEASDNLDWDEAEGKEKSRSRRSDRNARMEQDIKAMANDDTIMAREIMQLKKELSRLHFKVKHYHNQTRVVNAIINSVVIALLLGVLYKLYAA